MLIAGQQRRHAAVVVLVRENLEAGVDISIGFGRQPEAGQHVAQYGRLDPLFSVVGIDPVDGEPGGFRQADQGFVAHLAFSRYSLAIRGGNWSGVASNVRLANSSCAALDEAGNGAPCSPRFSSRRS